MSMAHNSDFRLDTDVLMRGTVDRGARVGHASVGSDQVETGLANKSAVVATVTLEPTYNKGSQHGTLTLKMCAGSLARTPKASESLSPEVQADRPSSRAGLQAYQPYASPRVHAPNILCASPQAPNVRGAGPRVQTPIQDMPAIVGPIPWLLTIGAHTPSVYNCVVGATTAQAFYGVATADAPMSPSLTPTHACLMLVAIGAHGRGADPHQFHHGELAVAWSTTHAWRGGAYWKTCMDSTCLGQSVIVFACAWARLSNIRI